MAKGKRYYSENDPEVGVTPSRLKRLGKARQLEYMTYWFHRNYADPAQETPYETAEGGYQYIWGGPYEANDELSNEFGDIVSEARIEEAVEIVQEDGIFDWAPGAEHPDQLQRAEDWAAERREEDEQRPPEINLDAIIRNLQDGLRPNYGDRPELDLRQRLLDEIEKLKAALASNKPHGGIGHNNPPLDDDALPEVAIAEIQKATDLIQKELGDSEPNALEVAKATLRLKVAVDWVARKVDAWTDSFAKESGGAAGKWTTRIASVYVSSKVFPWIGPLIGNVVSSASQWLHHVTLPF